MNGGYIMLDFENTSFTIAQSTHIPGIYDKVKHMMSVKKPIVAYNIILNDSSFDVLNLNLMSYTDSEIYFSWGATAVVVRYVRIQNDDNVTIYSRQDSPTTTKEI